jgi:phenylacetate-CoA ligase
LIQTALTSLQLRGIRSAVRADPGDLRKLQDRLLRDAVTHAYHHVPFYREFWRERGFDPMGFSGLQDLEEIPILTRRDLHRGLAAGRMLKRDIDLDTCSSLDTSGSSGNPPMRVLRGPLEQRVWRATGLCIWLEHGFHWRFVTARLQTHAGPSHPLQRLGISRVEWIPTNVPVDQQLKRLRSAKAHVVVVTPTAARRLAARMERDGLGLEPPRILFSQGELLDRASRSAIRKAFGVDPLNLYGQTEVGYMAWQCERRAGLHINCATHLVELRERGGPARPEELGRVVVTDLRGRTMPFLRYDTGDLARAASGSCSCGRTLPLLSSIEGRRARSVLSGDGRTVTQREVIDSLADRLTVDDYRLHQEKDGRFRLDLAPSVASRRDRVLETLRDVLGRVEVSVRVDPSWTTARDGKTNNVESALSPSL